MREREMERILVVDDELGVRQLLKKFLEHKGYMVAIAASGLEAIAAVEEHHPDLILLDIMLPGLNGLETLQRIREIDRTVEIIIVTGFSGGEMAKEAMRQVASDCVTKPIDLGYLELSILARLAQKDPSPCSHAGVRDA